MATLASSTTISVEVSVGVAGVANTASSTTSVAVVDMDADEDEDVDVNGDVDANRDEDDETVVVVVTVDIVTSSDEGWDSSDPKSKSCAFLRVLFFDKRLRKSNLRWRECWCAFAFRPAAEAAVAVCFSRVTSSSEGVDHLLGKMSPRISSFKAISLTAGDGATSITRFFRSPHWLTTSGPF